MIHKSIVETNSPRIPNISIKWISISSPRPVHGIEGILYINREKNSISIWDESNGKYVEFFGKSARIPTTDNSNLIYTTNDKTNSQPLYSFNLVDGSLVITHPDGSIVEIPIPNKDDINAKIRELEERIEKLEGLLD